MNVGVAVLAALSNAGENRLYVTLRAGHGSMHSAQRIFSLVVIEFRNSANRLPCVRRVAVLAGNVQASMWAVRAAGSLSPSFYRQSGKHYQKNRDRSEYTPSPHGLAPCLLSELDKVKNR